MSRQSSLETRLSNHLRCMAEDATDPELSSTERLALVRDRATQIREIRADLKANHVRTIQPRS